MKKFSIKKNIILSFLNQHSSEDYIIPPLGTNFIIIEGNTAYYDYLGVRRETNNTVASILSYIDDDAITEIL
jgi:hypothetical protein